MGCVILRFSDFQQKSMGVQSKSAVFEAHPREGGPKTCTELHDTPFSRLRGKVPGGRMGGALAFGLWGFGTPTVVAQVHHPGFALPSPQPPLRAPALALAQVRSTGAQTDGL